MGKKLVIVESPAKAKTINKILGSDYNVQSSVGHVRDLPLKTIGVDVRNGFVPKYVTARGKKKVLDALKKSVASADDTVYLAPDPDREGEAIAWHLQEVLTSTKHPKRFVRVQYNEITPRAVREAFENPGELNMPRVDAQQARRILDRIVGYMVSPMLWRRIRRGLSAGRVQSVALRLVCEREQIIRDFVPEAFWVIGARARKRVAPLDPFELKLAEIDGEKADVRQKGMAEGINNDLKDRSLVVADVTTREVTRKAPPPFITSSLQQAGSGRLHFSPRRTMMIAQKLYEGIDLDGDRVGLITYMRTDSFSISQDALGECRRLITEKFGAEFCPEKPNFFKKRASAQEAHEAIRPTDVTRDPDSLASLLEPAELKLYRLIWQRFVASQMTPAKIDQRTVLADAAPPAAGGPLYRFRATASEVTFAGFMKVAGSELLRNDNDENGADQSLPPVEAGEALECLEWLSEEKETKPPSRYSEAALVRTLEKEGVGRPSTYAQILSTLQQRSYVERQKRILVPTDLGMEVSTFLVTTLGELFDVKFTAAMEESLDEVEEGTVDWTAMLDKFYEKFDAWMGEARLPPADPELVARVLAVLSVIKEWAPPVQRGKRVYSDEKFVASLNTQLAAGEKAISQRQLETLIKIACRYREQAPGIEEVLKESGQEAMLNDASLQPPKESTLRKMDLARKLDLNESATSFVESLGSQVDAGRCLSEAQLKALNNIVVAHSKQITDFESMREELEVEGSEVAEDEESGPLIEAMKAVVTWNEPVTRGKRVFNDKAFYDSLCEHFGRKGFLSPRQRAALKKMVARYADQIEGYEQLAERFGIAKPKSRE